ncbi:MAG: FAD-binding oxidoreductase [Chromatiales bacterium]|nr:FAD-binding oxidoreductase [Chromatiales bacterium]
MTGILLINLTDAQLQANLRGNPTVSTFSDSLWSESAIAPVATPPLAGNAETDVAVVGAGFTGLSTALHLAEQGRNVTVLEAQEPGFGCSGRNGGQVNPGSTRMPPQEVLDKLGPDWGERFLQFGDRSCDLVFELIDRYGIECEAVRPGYVQGGYGAKGDRANARWAEQWQARGVAVQPLDREALHALIGTRGYDGGLLDPRGGSVQPLSYARGLAKACVDQGVNVHGSSHVTAINRDGAGWKVGSANGSVNARYVVLATNGYTDDLWPGLRQTVVPVTSFIAATEPLSHNVAASVVPGRHAVSETARVIVYYRRDATGRFVIGGHGNLFNSQERGDKQHVHNAALKLFPQLEGVAWEFSWGGWPAMTKDHFPRLFELDDGVYAGLGYNGRGVASATLMGQQLATVIQGSEDPLIRPQPLERFAFHGMRQAGISFHLLTRSALDTLDGKPWR